MENIFFEAFLYMATICFICCIRYNPQTAAAHEYKPIDLSPIWDAQEQEIIPDPWTLSINSDKSATLSPVNVTPIPNLLEKKQKSQPMPNLNRMNTRQLRQLAQSLKIPAYSRILRHRKTAGLREAIRQYLAA
ncbi:MAG: hypothetical protein MUD14_03335 [Hydrococcus sp. Prado102]|nr:hypothetical protein [Hydrococcus sp. Prado102]